MPSLTTISRLINRYSCYIWIHTPNNMANNTRTLLEPFNVEKYIQHKNIAFDFEILDRFGFVVRGESPGCR